MTQKNEQNDEELKEIYKILSLQDYLETPVEQQHKEQVLAKLSEAVKKWIIQTAKKALSLNEEAAQHVQSQLFTFGS